MSHLTIHVLIAMPDAKDKKIKKIIGNLTTDIGLFCIEIDIYVLKLTKSRVRLEAEIDTKVKMIM